MFPVNEPGLRRSVQPAARALSVAVVWLVWAVSAQAADGLFHLNVANQSGTNDEVYVVFTALSSASPNACFITFDADGSWNQFVEVTSGDFDSTKYAYKLSDLSGTPTFRNIPNVLGGRVYFSIKYPMLLGIGTDAKTGGYTIDGPDPVAKTDSNYLTVYDKCEYSLNGVPKLYFNTSAVDFFCMPISISAGGSSAGLSTDRAAILALANKELKAPWNQLLLQYGGTTTLRIVAPDKLTTFNNLDYLGPYINGVWTYYQQTNRDHRMSVNCEEIWKDPKKPKHPPESQLNGTNYVLEGYVDGTNGWVFESVQVPGQPAPNPVLTVKLAGGNNGKPNSKTVFGASSTSPFEFENHTIRAVLVRELVSAMNVGVVPVAGNPVLEKSYFQPSANAILHDGMDSAKNKMFKPNPLAPQTGGPWYNLYSKVLHSFKAPIYAFAYDDALGMDSTLRILSPAASPVTVDLTIHGLSGMTIPVQQRNRPTYDIMLGFPGPPPHSLEYVLYYDFGSGWTYAKTSGEKHDNVPAKFKIKYGLSGSEKVYQVDCNKRFCSAENAAFDPVSFPGYLFIGLGPQ